MAESIAQTSKFIAYLRECLKTEAQLSVTPQDLALIERFLVGAKSAEVGRAEQEVDIQYQTEMSTSLRRLKQNGN